MLNKLNNFSSPHLLLFPQMHTNTLTNKHIHAEKSKQRYTCSKKKKKNTKIHKHTHTQTNPYGQTTKRQIGASRNDRCLICTWLERLELVGLVWLELVGMGLAWSELVGMGLAWSKLWRSVLVNRCLIRSCGSELGRSVLAWSELWFSACDRDGVD